MQKRADDVVNYFACFHPSLFAALAVAAAVAGFPFLTRTSFSWTEMNVCLQSFVFALAASSFYHAGFYAGTANAMRLLLISFSISYAAEITGTQSTWLFGTQYDYHPAVVPQLPGAIPLAVPLMWFCLSAAAQVFLGPLTVRSQGTLAWKKMVLKAALSALFLVATDLSLDPLGVATGLWTWTEPGGYFGSPYRNFAGWFLVGFTICTCYLVVEKPRQPTSTSDRLVLEESFALVTLLLAGIFVAACWIHLPDGFPMAMTLFLLGPFWSYWAISPRVVRKWRKWAWAGKVPGWLNPLTGQGRRSLLFNTSTASKGGRMRPRATRHRAALALTILLGAVMASLAALASGASTALDARVEKFLNEKRSDWHEWNVPYQDGKVLHDLILRNKYTRALEIGTSSGHSAIWIAWALSKTGGRLITVEIDAERLEKARQNFKAAGLEAFIDARRADAHQLVKELEGPFDFVFLDADKEWYVQYFKDLDPKLVRGGCFTAHNASNAFAGIKEFLDTIRGRPDYQTSIDRSSSSGISISTKK